MATLAATVPTLVEWAKRRDPDDTPARIIEMLSQKNPILSDMSFIEGNLPTGLRSTLRTGLPTVQFRQLNQAVTPSRSTTKQSDDQTAILEAWAECDVRLAQMSGDEAAFRLSEAQAFIESMSQTMAATVFYGNSGIDPEKFTGFAPRFAALSGTTSKNVISATASPSGGDQASIWLVGWSPDTVTGIYPKGTTAGLQHNDFGAETAEVTAGIGATRMRVYRDQFVWELGLAVRDWRYVVRIANVDMSALTSETGNADLVKVMSRAIDRLPSTNGVNPVFYTTRSVLSWLRVQALAKSSNAVTVEPALNQFGQRIGDISFLGIPVRFVDQLLETEAIVT